MPDRRSTIPRKAIERKLAERDYGYHEVTKRGVFWKRKGTTERVHLPKANRMDALAARHVLRQAGFGEKEVESFLRAAEP